MKHWMSCTLARTALAWLAAVSMAGCSPGAEDGPVLNHGTDPSAIVFLTQAEPAGVFMDALFQGRIYRDAQGCLRLETLGDDHPTPVWPYGFRLVSGDGEFHVHDAEGRSVGRVGDSFRFGGGVGSSLSHGVLSAEQHQLAERRCPGSYWMVGQTDVRP